jgi:acyl carrier protein
MDNLKKLRDLLVDVLLLGADEFRTDLRKEEVETWDSLAIVALATGVEETFGYHMSESEALAIGGVDDLIALLQSKGISFGD